MTAVVLSAFVAGAGLLAVWIDTRWPKLAPEELPRRVLVAACAVFALAASPVLDGSAAELYATLFAVLLPALVSTLLACVWMMRALRDLQPS